MYLNELLIYIASWWPSTLGIQIDIRKYFFLHIAGEKLVSDLYVYNTLR